MLAPGMTLDQDRYRVEAVIGRGGFGHVYLAHERLTDQKIAIKELVPAFVDDPQAVQRFVQEARVTLTLSHTNIVRTYRIFDDRDTYYLAMEYLPKGSLRDKLKGGALPVAEATSVAVELCDALAYAHSKGVVHCDIKPANVLFDEMGQARLADFGIAHVSEHFATRRFVTAAGLAFGTVRYMAPEQLEGIRDSPAVDTYAVGAVFYEMLCGAPYLDFEEETTPAAQVRNIRRVQSESPRPLQEANPLVPDWLDQLVSRALRKSARERFATARALREALLAKTPSLKADHDGGRGVLADPGIQFSEPAERGRREGYKTAHAGFSSDVAPRPEPILSEQRNGQLGHDDRSARLRAGAIGGVVAVALALFGLIPCLACITSTLGLVLYVGVGVMTANWMAPPPPAGKAARGGAVAGTITALAGGITSSILTLVQYAMVGGVAPVIPQIEVLPPELRDSWGDLGMDPNALADPAWAIGSSALCCSAGLLVAAALGAAGGAMTAYAKKDAATTV